MANEINYLSTPNRKIKTGSQTKSKSCLLTIKSTRFNSFAFVNTSKQNGLKKFTRKFASRQCVHRKIRLNYKGQLISKCPFGIFKSYKKNNEIFSRISALASKKRSNQKSRVRESK